MNYIYYINDFLENNENYFCRCCINKTFSYVIISDLYFIFLQIIKENKQKGKMKFLLELNKLKSIEIFSNEKKIKLLWEEDALLKDVEYKHEIIFENNINLNEFINKIKEKKDKLLQTFGQFDDDEIRNSPSNILRMINYNENLFKKIRNKVLDINNVNTKKDISDGLYFKNLLIIYYKKAINLYCLEEKNKIKFNQRLVELLSDKIIK